MSTGKRHTEPLSEAEVRRLAHLARLAPARAEIESLRTDLANLLAMAHALTEADLEGAEPMTTPVEAVNRLREDEPGETLPASAIERLAPETHDDGSIRVPPVLGDGGGA